MKRGGRLVPVALVVVLLAACNRDVATGVPALSASRAAGDNKLKDAIAFFTREFSPADGGLAVMNPDGSGRRPLAGGELGFEPSISPDGRQVAFSRNTDVGVTSIFVMNVDGTGTTEVSHGLVFNPTPRWSPDGCQIAFGYSQGDQQTGPRISVVNADGSGFRVVTPDPAPNEFVYEEGPTWSPDGTRLAFTRNAILHVINEDGSGLTALPNEDLALNAAWSPDGQRIAYFSAGEIHMRNADGSNLRVVTSTPGAFDAWPRWSADGSRLVFSRFINDFVQVFTINVDGTDAAGLTPAGVHDFMPDWGFRHSSTRCSRTID